MSQRRVTIVNKLGLHARAAAKLVATAGRFESEIKLLKAHAEVNAKSILGVMMLAAAKGSELTLIAEGTDESDALDALEDLIARRFDEDE
ncbi:MAG TPA: HPr family phosphocarrier protein [Chromatiales bacterium]|nr:HPr family phosphocarrier protein [Chromatiales bacterium]HEX23108.1 HPr family phosphocarrier protein [Chromatiales bacterium]